MAIVQTYHTFEKHIRHMLTVNHKSRIRNLAWMMTGIPVIGVILVIIILIPSHIFNLVINALGGFIHTMRLQYIEFFGRFYTGGSKPFKPYQYETNYVEIE